MCKTAAFWPSMANWTLTNSAIRRALDRFVGIDARRKLPLFAAETFESWFAKRNKSEFGNPTSQSSNGKVVFFHDTFVNYNYPDIGKAAVQLLEAAGYEVRLAHRKCCGRPMIATGLPKAGRENAAFNASRLSSFVQEGYSII